MTHFILELKKHIDLSLMKLLGGKAAPFMTNYHYLLVQWNNELICHLIITAHKLVQLCSLLQIQLLMIWDLYVFQRERLDFSLCWHQPSITAWQMYRCVGSRLAERWEAKSSRDHGTQSLARSIKHWETAFSVGNWAAWVLSHTVENVMLSLDLKSTCKSFLCLAHSIEEVSDKSFRSLGPHGFLCGDFWELPML